MAGRVLAEVVDGLKGFPEAIESVYPEAVVQTCIAQQALCPNSRNSASFGRPTRQHVERWSAQFA